MTTRFIFNTRRRKPSRKSYLTLGWRVTANLEPRYWLNKGAKPGFQPTSALFRTPAPTIASHTAIIAQSGAGKSFFLGRLLEEIILRTQARCVILDPNADFRKMYLVKDETLWTKAAYDAARKRGKLPHEKSRIAFARHWERVPIRILGEESRNQNCRELRIWWPDVSVEFLAEDADPMLRGELFHCHRLVRGLAAFWTGREIDIIEEFRRIFRLARELSTADLRSKLDDEFSEWISLIGEGGDRAFAAVKRLLIERAVIVSQYVSPEVERFYFGKALEYQAEGILYTGSREPWDENEKRVEVIDLPSLPSKSTRLLAINAILTREWEQARFEWSEYLERAPTVDRRVPTFIVVDEAHNLIPNETKSNAEDALKGQFRTIVSEGRKYGLFVILVSQRPDKLDHLLLSECENKAVMRLNSESILAITSKLMGLHEVRPDLLRKCLEFGIGGALLAGPWAPDGPEAILSAARRTVEGGRNLREEHWARPGRRGVTRAMNAADAWLEEIKIGLEELE